jgi:signal-transduction protein with cAMP-binding, CBS, and nucleotidyltransferase domain
MSYDESIFDVCKAMYGKRIGSMIVDGTDSKHGIFTERDLVFKVLNNKGSLDEPIELYSSFPLITAKDGILANEAASIMALHHIKRLGLTDNGKITGVVTVRDIVDAYQSGSPQIKNY